MHTTPLIYTDMDGTLLDHHTYSFAAAVPLLTKLKGANIPVIPNTSKTFDELLELRRQIQLSGPFIIENGAAICFPQDYIEPIPQEAVLDTGCWIYPLTEPRQHWLQIVERLKEDFGDCFTHFKQMSIQNICESTGLNPHQAKLAASRRFGEPILWLTEDSRKQAFLAHARELGATPLQGGRFMHICGQCDKGVALKQLSKMLAAQSPEKSFTSIALGDSQNDVAMLEAADIAVRIKSPTHSFPQLSRTENVYDSKCFGPEGWVETMSALLKQLP